MGNLNKPGVRCVMVVIVNKQTNISTTMTQSRGCSCLLLESACVVAADVNKTNENYQVSNHCDRVAAAPATHQLERCATRPPLPDLLRSCQDDYTTLCTHPHQVRQRREGLVLQSGNNLGLPNSRGLA